MLERVLVWREVALYHRAQGWKGPQEANWFSSLPLCRQGTVICGFGRGKPFTELVLGISLDESSPVSHGEALLTWAFALDGLTALLGGRHTYQSKIQGASG